MSDNVRQTLIFIVFLSVVIFLLAGCTHTERVPMAYPMPNVPEIRAAKLNPVEWRAYNRAELQELIARNPSGDQIALVAVTPEGYKNLSMNLGELERYIKQQKQVIVFLKKTLKQRSR